MISKRYLTPVIAGVVVFGAVTAFAAGFTLTSNTVVSGNQTVSACNSTAVASYTTKWDPALVPAAYAVDTVTVTTGAGCGTMAYKVTLTGTGNVSLAERSANLVAGVATPNFFASLATDIPAANILGVSVTITG